MNINEMSEQEKNVALAKLMGWEYTYRGSELLIEPPEYVNDPFGKRIMGFYHPSCMAYAWRVLNWIERKAEEAGSRSHLYNSWMSFLPEQLFELPPEQAQAKWLDYALNLAVEAGMVE